MDEIKLFSECKKNGMSQRISNTSYIHALSLTDWMFQNTMSSLKILCGPSIDGFLSVMRESFKGALRRIKEKDNVAQIIIAGPQIPQEITDIQQEIPGGLKAIAALPAKPEIISHFIVSDSATRQEKPHLPLTDDMDINVIKATIDINNIQKVKILTRTFDEIWSFLSSKQ